MSLSAGQSFGSQVAAIRGLGGAFRDGGGEWRRRNQRPLAEKLGVKCSRWSGRLLSSSGEGRWWQGRSRAGENGKQCLLIVSNTITMASSETSVTADAEGEIGAKVDQAASGENGAVQQDGGDKSGEAAAANAAADRKFGFTRPEMCSKNLVGSVNFYERHLFLSYKDPEVWPASVESKNFDRLPRSFVAALKARKNDLPKKTRMTLCGVSEHSSAGDVLIFPEMRHYKGLTHDDVDPFVEAVLVKGTEWKGTKSAVLKGSHIFICAHGSRDKRCGVCGVALIEKFQEEIKARSLEKQISVHSCSHVGGHKYAGNVIVFSGSGPHAGSGHWYGYVAPADVPTILDQHIGKGEIIDRLWRGQMGVSEADQKEFQQSRLAGQESNKGSNQADGIVKEQEAPNPRATLAHPRTILSWAWTAVSKKIK